ncbi:MAG: nicotinate-nucleotide--dimethylbenzimidazole phosphoribosyltransferase [Dehalococcoidia bacterium]|nr:nicotinate-nucleotide--dimethylbenzimidazole phosphoribosyltransferase [Dehalococcoidia bacterium]
MTEADARLIAETARAIPALDEAAGAAARARQARLTKPPGALGRLESLSEDIAAMTGRDRPRLEHRAIVVAAGDHGVAARGVSAYPPEVTAQMVANFLGGGAAISVLAHVAGARLRVVDAGVRGPTGDDPRLLRLRIGPGTADITEHPAMPPEHARRSLAAGIELVREEHDTGLDLLGLGEMGIGNSTAAAAIVAAVTGLPPRSVTGRGTGVDDSHYAAKIAAVEAALARHRSVGGDGVSLLASLGGYEIGVLAGCYLAAASLRVPVLVDGLISGAAALVAAAIEPRAARYMLASHLGVEPGHRATLEHLGLRPILDFELRLGEGTGAALAMNVCLAACRLLDEMATFDEAGVSDSDQATAPED